MEKVQFGVGEYETRDGRKAIVLRILPTGYLIGVVLSRIAGVEVARLWHDNGRTNAAKLPGDGDTSAVTTADDLMPPARYETLLLYRWPGGDRYHAIASGGDTHRPGMSAGSIRLRIEGSGADERVVRADYSEAVPDAAVPESRVPDGAQRVGYALVKLGNVLQVNAMSDTPWTQPLGGDWQQVRIRWQVESSGRRRIVSLEVMP